MTVVYGNVRRRERGTCGRMMMACGTLVKCYGAGEIRKVRNGIGIWCREDRKSVIMVCGTLLRCYGARKIKLKKVRNE